MPQATAPFPFGPIGSVAGRAVVVSGDDIDTDRIIPARFLKCVTFDGLGAQAFADDRSERKGHHPFDLPHFQGASILVVNRNFGRGSSREHAPQALMRWGIRVLIGESFSEIFFGNCTTLGIPCVTATRSDLEKLTAAINADPKVSVTVDLNALQAKAGSLTVSIAIPDGARLALTTGKWDFLGQLLEGADAVQAAAKKLPYMAGFKA